MAQSKVLVDNGNIHLEFNNDEFRSFQKNKNSTSSLLLKSSDYVELKNNTNCDIYFKWINPLKYSIKFEDSIYTDTRVEMINEFILGLSGLFDKIPLSVESNQENLKLSGENAEETNSGIKLDSISFEDNRLNELVFECSSIYPNKQDSATLITYFNKIKVIDSLSHHAQKDSIVNIFKHLFEISDHNNISQIIEKQKIKRVEVEKFLLDKELKIENLISDLNGKKFTLANYSLKKYFQSVIFEVHEDIIREIRIIQNTLNELDNIIKIFETSVDTSLLSKEFLEYYRLHNISFQKSESINLKIIIYERKVDYDNMKLIDNHLFKSISLLFRKYDPISVFVSTGLFYSDVSLNSFGVDLENSTITMNELSANKAVTAAFLNFTFLNQSDFLRPFFQIGIDPLKKSPYLLLGGGFLIPSTNFSISGGPLWTWEQTLQSLNVGDSIESTDSLESDIQGEFQVRPKGWYFGIQYNIN